MNRNQSIKNHIQILEEVKNKQSRIIYVGIGMTWRTLICLTIFSRTWLLDSLKDHCINSEIQLGQIVWQNEHVIPITIFCILIGIIVNHKMFRIHENANSWNKRRTRIEMSRFVSRTSVNLKIKNQHI